MRRPLMLTLLSASILCPAAEIEPPREMKAILARMEGDIRVARERALAALESELKDRMRQGELDRANLIRDKMDELRSQLPDAKLEETRFLPAGVLAVLYAEDKFAGSVQEMRAAGRFPHPPEIGNDTVRSVRVRPGYEVVLWENTLGSGRSWRIRTDTSGLPPAASSYELRKL